MTVAAEHRDANLQFVTRPEVTLDDNLAERDLRMMTVKQKISGCFRTVDGAQVFSDIRSYISTARKQGLGVLDALVSVFEGSPLMLERPGPAG